MPKNREPSFDLLRVLSAFAVVLIHVSATFLQMNAGVPTNCHFSAMVLNLVGRFAVPCFLMLSGAFILADERNADYKYFYRKSFRNIGITSIVFCMLYVFYRIARIILSTFVLNKHSTEYFLDKLFEVINGLLVGRPDGHLWYLFMLIGLYLAAPFVIRLAADLHRGGVNLYGKITVVYLALASASDITSEHKLRWDIGYQLCFLSYFLMGYKLRHWGKNRKNNRTAILLIFSGMLVNIILAYINYIRGIHGLQVDVGQYYRNPFSFAPLAPIEIVAACLIFAGFSVLDIKRDFSILARYTFLIYLLHIGVWEVILAILKNRVFGVFPFEFAEIILLSAIVFGISLFLAIIYKRIPYYLKREGRSC